MWWVFVLRSGVQSGTIPRCQKTWHNAICSSLVFSCKSILVVWAKGGWAGRRSGGGTNGWRGMQPCIGSTGLEGPPTSSFPSSLVHVQGCFSHSPASRNMGGKHEQAIRMEPRKPIRDSNHGRGAERKRGVVHGFQLVTINKNSASHLDPLHPHPLHSVVLEWAIRAECSPKPSLCDRWSHPSEPSYFLISCSAGPVQPKPSLLTPLNHNVKVSRWFWRGSQCHRHAGEM